MLGCQGLLGFCVRGGKNWASELGGGVSLQDHLHEHATSAITQSDLGTWRHAPEIHTHFEEGAPFVRLQCTLPIGWSLLSSAHVVVLWLHVSCDVYKTGTPDGEGTMLQGTKQCLCSSEAS